MYKATGTIHNTKQTIQKNEIYGSEKIIELEHKPNN
jgi:hypothetical protein